MTKRSRSSLFIAIAFLSIAGCSDPCDDMNCLNNGACNDGTCVCPDGFTGEFCQTTVAPPPDPCENVNCGSNGDCVDGNCVCEQGYEGENCQTESRAKFIGTFLVDETCIMTTDNYIMTIAASSTSVRHITMINLYDQDHGLLGTVDGNTIQIGPQTVNGATYSGSGTIAGNVMTLAFTIQTPNDAESCNITATKQ